MGKTPNLDSRPRFDFSTIKVESNVPVPDRLTRHREGGLSAILRGMKDGDSIVLPIERRGSAVAAAKLNNISIITRTVQEDPTKARIWRVGLVDPTKAEPTALPPKKTKTALSVPRLTVARK